MRRRPRLALGLALTVVAVATVGTAAVSSSGAPAAAQYQYSWDSLSPDYGEVSVQDGHWTYQWSNDRVIDLYAWATDDDYAGNPEWVSGIRGFAASWDTSPYGDPGPYLDYYGNWMNFTSPALSDGKSHYLHLRAVDNAGNWSWWVIDFGPFWIDSTAPGNPALSSTSHTPGIPSADPTVDVVWSGATDGNGSGIDGYSYEWSSSSTTVPDATKDAEEFAGAATSPAITGSSTMWFHLRTRDNAGNWSNAVHLGPFGGDSSPPTITPAVAGNTGWNSWYTGPVSIAWSVMDPESTVSTTGCGPLTVTNNTKSASFTCQATSAGGTTSKTVTVKVDMAPPTVKCQKARFTYGQRGAIVRARVSDSISGVLNRFLSKKVNTKTGKRHVTFVGRDRAGNATTKICYYTVRR